MRSELAQLPRQQPSAAPILEGWRSARLLELAEGDFEYCDVLGEVRAGRQRLKARGVVLAGSWWHPPRA